MSHTMTNCHMLDSNSLAHFSGNLLLDGMTNLFGHISTLLDRSLHWNLDRDIHTVWNIHTSGDSHSSGNLDGNILALPLSNSLASRCSSNCWGNITWYKGTNKRSHSTNVSISISIRICFSLSIPLHNMSQSRGSQTVTSNVDTSNSSYTSKDSTSGMSSNSTTNCMANDICVGLNSDMLLSANLSNNILALLSDSSIHNSLGFSCALLLGCALLLRYNCALLLGHIFGDGVALGNRSGRALLLWHILNCCSTIRD